MYDFLARVFVLYLATSLSFLIYYDKSKVVQRIENTEKGRIARIAGSMGKVLDGLLGRVIEAHRAALILNNNFNPTEVLDVADKIEFASLMVWNIVAGLSLAVQPRKLGFEASLVPDDWIEFVDSALAKAFNSPNENTGFTGQ